jgi:hypothetical protein
MSIRHATLGVCLGLVGGAAALLAASFDADAGPRTRGAARTSINHAGSGAHAGAANRGAHAANVNRSAAGNRAANVNRTANVDRNTNVNRNTNIDVHNDIDIDVDDHWHNDWYDDHPVATAAAVTGAVALTAAAVGSIANSVPPSCVTTVVNGIAYQQCGSTWYQPQYAGTQVQYVVVNPPN